MKVTETLKQEVKVWIEEHREEMLDFYREFVSIEGRHGETQQMRKNAEFLRSHFEAAGLETEVIETGEINGPVVTAVLNKGVSSREMVFTGHYDTVFESGSWGRPPFVIEGNKVYGPGVSDMKGGITVAFYTVKALKELGFTECPVRLFFVGDEEVNHQGGNAIELMKKFTKNILVAFNMESGYDEGKICVGRKGCYEYKLAVHGVSGHPGHAIDSAKNAIEEISHKIIALQAVTPKDKNRTYSVSVDTIKGGTVTNCVPDYCEAMIDVRVSTMAALRECEENMFVACTKTYVDGTNTQLICTDAMIPYETTPNVMAAYEALKKVSEMTDHPIPGSIVVGGSSDAAYIAAQGSKVLCQCGVRGGLIHNEGEYAILDSLFERTELFILAAYEHELFK